MEDEAHNEDDPASTVVGRRPRQSTAKERIFGAVLIGAVLVYAIVSRHILLVGFYLFLGLIRFALHLRPPTVVSATGIRRPWRPRSVIGWSQVASVSLPVPGKFAPRLNLRSGKSVVLDDIPGDQSSVIAEIGGKELLVPPPYKPPPPSLPSQRPRTDLEIEADVDRRARALAEERRRLAGES